ncbi:MAG: hypothetical protein HQL48_11410 [Gammaproteobacteria bacterium]|nr:hypothetical protein [Gammaproteobacteria bacterium]
MMTDEQQGKVIAQLTNTVVKLEVVAERHQSERLYHIRRTNIMVRLVSIFLTMLAMVNVYYLTVFSTDMFAIVDTIQELDGKVVMISSNMVNITETMASFDGYMDTMPAVSDATRSIAERMPRFGSAMGDIMVSMQQVDLDMKGVNGSMNLMNRHFFTITNNIEVMGTNVGQFAKPMGMLNRFLP